MDKPNRLRIARPEDRPRPLYPYEQQKLGQLSLLPSVWSVPDLLPEVPTIIIHPPEAA